MNVDDMEGLDEETRKEIEELQKVTREKDGNESYVSSRFLIFEKSSLLKDYDKGILALRDIVEEDEVYQYAQRILIGAYLYRKKDLKSAFELLQHVKEVDFLKNFDFTFLRIASLYIVDSETRDINRARIALELCKNTHSYKNYCYSKICDLLEEEDTKNIGESYLAFFELLVEAYELLVIDYSDKTKESSERKLAHYTNTKVTNILLNKEGRLDSHKYLRLNTISNVNDPSEGELVKILLGKEDNLEYSEQELDKNLHAFISCFTFNHDSLNQFRLYGKKDNKEASGISLVFKKNFFQENMVKGMSFLSLNSENKDLTGDRGDKSKELKNKRVLSSGTDENKYLIMRCVYIDPNSKYIQLAQRNRLTFYREFEDKEVADKKWQTYQDEIKEKTEDFEVYIDRLKEIYTDINNQIEGLKNNNGSYRILLSQLLLPLKYLIKHSAFQEEQECRIIYVTSLNDPKVKMVYGEALYVEYEADVKTHLDKIYIAPAATQYQPYLAKLLCDTDVKIELSNNPFRLPTSH